MNSRSPIAVVLALLCASECVAAPPARIRLVDVTASSRIAFRHSDGESGQQYLFELMTAGLALFDYNNDGLVDVYLLNGEAPNGRAPLTNALYRNEGDWTFTDVTDQAGVGDTRHGLGVTVGDYDNDGDPDLYVSNFGPNSLYCNNGDGTFTNVSRPAGADCGSRFGAGAAFLDFDNDGDLDLYAAQYVDFSFERHRSAAARSYPYPPSQKEFPAAPDVLLRNDGNGAFTDVSKESGIAQHAAPSMGVVCLDYDDDRDTDVLVCNDGAANYLFQNDGHGAFREVGVLAGIAFDLRGVANGSMGADHGDFDNDGRIDVFMTNYTGESPVLYQNLGAGFYDMTNVARAGQTLFPHTNWGCGLIDFDNDRDLDIFVANGHFLRNIREVDDRTSYHVRDTLLMNDDGRYVDVSAEAGSGLRVNQSSRGVGFDDLDNDGRVDVVTLNANAGPTVMRNETEPRGHWLQIQLMGTASNRDGVGARVVVASGDVTQTSEQQAGRGYQSYYGRRLCFGAGEDQEVRSVKVYWPSGAIESFSRVPVDRRVVLIEGQGTVLVVHEFTQAP